MTNADFWNSIDGIVRDNFTSEGLSKLDTYAADFISGKLVYQRFSPQEQHGCAIGGYAHVVASLIAGAETGADSIAKELSDFKRQQQRAASQAVRIEQWARTAGCWFENIDEQMSSLMGEQIAEGGEAHVYDHGSTTIKTIGLDYFIEPILALDRISLHNAYFPETKMMVLGFGRDANDEFRILVEQPFIEGTRMADDEIREYVESIGFMLQNARNWTYTTPDIYLSDMHDENVIRTKNGVAVIDCDIRINTPECRAGGNRELTTEVLY